MWISRKDYDSLVARVDKLERFERYDAHFTVYKTTDRNFMYENMVCIPHQKITLQTAILRVMSHLGLRMEYVEGKPAEVAFVPIAAKEGKP